jgi:hypothetical protein
MSEGRVSFQPKRPSFYKKRYLDQIDSFLNDLLRDLQKDDPNGLKRLLDFYSTKFQRWSPSNIIGIFIQKPACERPVTVSEVKALGHTIKPGVPRATILVPVYKPEEEIESNQDEVTKTDNRVDGEAEPREESHSRPQPEKETPTKLKLVGFKVVPCVVDLGKDTEGPPILSNHKAEQYQAAEPLIAALRACAAERNVKVDDRLDPRGVTSGATGHAVENKDGSIHISTLSVQAAPRRFASLVHELTHGILHLGPETEKLDAKTKELQATSVSYFVGKHFGLTEEFSGLYLKNWGVSAKDLLKNLSVIVKTSREIVEGIGKHLEQKEQEVATTRKELLPDQAPILNLDLEDEYEIEEVEEIVDDTPEHFSQVVYVYHAKDPKMSDTAEFNEENYTLVARCESSNLADAFGRTQNIEGSWAAGGDVDVTVYGPKRQRSSSVGDVFFVEDEGYYKANQDGWVLFKEAQSEKPLTV